MTILHRNHQPLAHFDPDLVNMLLESSGASDIDVQLDTEVHTMEKRSDRKFTVIASTKQGSNHQGQTDMVIHGAGRVPEIGDLALETAHVHAEKKQGVLVNEFLQSVSNPQVYAAGDATMNTGGLPLTPVASYEGEIVAANLLKGNHRKPDNRGLPSVVFTIPPLAAVGLSEQEAKQQKIKFQTKYENTSSWYSSRRIAKHARGLRFYWKKRGIEF